MKVAKYLLLGILCVPTVAFSSSAVHMSHPGGDYSSHGASQIEARAHDLSSHAAPKGGRHLHGAEWIGYSRFAEQNYALGRPFRYGHFRGGFGPEHTWNLHGHFKNRFWFGGWWWSIALWDWDLCDNWLWDSDLVYVYEDADHIGWYIAYNPRARNYVHVKYLGSGAADSVPEAAPDE